MNPTTASTTAPGDRSGRSSTEAAARACTGPQRSPLYAVADVLSRHHLPAAVTPTGTLQLRVGTARFSAHVVRVGDDCAIELRAHREGRRSLLGCVTDPGEAAHQLIRFASLAGAWQFAAEIFDRLVLRNDLPVLSSVPVSGVVYVRLGSRTYAAIEVDEADPCLDTVATAHVTTYIAACPIDDEWRFERLDDRRFDVVGRVEGGSHEDVGTVLSTLDVHRARVSDWERLH